MSAGIGLIAVDTPFARHMAARLAARPGHGDHPLVAILAIVDPPQPPKQRASPLIRRLRRFVSAHDRALHRVWREETVADAHFRAETGPPPDWPAGSVVREVERSAVNAPDTVAWLQGFDLRLLTMAGAPIVRPPVIAAAQAGMLNIHSSLLPRYKGTRAEFWQVHNDETHLTGMTVHFVDPGVDSGDIVLQVPQRAKLSDGPWMMRVRNQLNALDALPDAVSRVLDGTADRVPQAPVDERPYRAADITPAAIRKVLDRMDGRRVS